MPILSRRHFVLGSALATVSATSARGADYPDRPIRVIIPFAAGGSGDILFRLLAELVSSEIGQPFIVINKPGAGGNIGMQEAASARPDGYTLFCGATNNFVINQHLYSLRYDPLTALQPIMKLADIPTVLYASTSVPATLQSFIDYAKANPGRLSYSSPGIGTTPHLDVERLKQRTGIDVRHIPYSGAPQALQALLVNEVQLYGAGAVIGKAHVDQKSINALAVCARQRLPILPDVPTADEAGQQGFYAANWFALAAPSETPTPVIDALYLAFRRAVQAPTLEARFAELGFLKDLSGPDDLKKSFVREALLWKETTERAGLSK